MSQMISPLAYASQLLLSRILEEKQDKGILAQVAGAAKEATDELTAAEHRAQQQLAGIYKDLSQSELQQLLVDIANDSSFGVQALLQMNQHQLQIY